MFKTLFFVSADAGKLPPFLRFAGESLRRFLIPRPNDFVLTEMPYVFVLPVSDTRVFFDESAMDDASEAFFLARIPVSVLKDLANGCCVLIIDISNEGIYYSKRLFQAILRWLHLHQIEESRIIILNQNRALRTHFACDFSDSRLAFFCYDYFIRSISCLFNASSFEPTLIDAIGRQGLLLERYRRVSLTIASSVFLCLNATPRPHRMLFLALLKSTGLLSSTLYTFHGVKSQKGMQFGPEMAVQLAHKLGFVDLREDISSFSEWVSPFEDKFSERGNELAMRIDPQVYERTFASLVTETEIADGGMARVTEKSLKPLFMGHPLLIFGNVGSLKILHDFGFQTFSPYIDETYDRISSAAERSRALLRSIVALRDSIQLGDASVIGPLEEIARYNSNFAQQCFPSAYELKYDFR